MDSNQLKPNFHYTRGITPKRVTNDGAHLQGLAPKQHSYEKTSQRWRQRIDLTGPGSEPQTSRPNKGVLYDWAKRPVY